MESKVATSAEHVVSVPNEPWFKPPKVAVDCLYGGSRSVLISMVTFAFVVVSATTIVIFSLQKPVVETVRFAYQVPPPDQAFLGAPLANFSVSLTSMPRQAPLEGVGVTLSLYPLQPIALTAMLPSSQSFLIETVDCLASAYGTDPLWRQNHDLICNVSEYLSVTKTTTDASGIATFTNVVAPHGSATKYMLVVERDRVALDAGAPMVVLKSILKMQVAPLWIHVDRVTATSGGASGADLVTVKAEGTVDVDLRIAASSNAAAADVMMAMAGQFAQDITGVDLLGGGMDGSGSGSGPAQPSTDDERSEAVLQIFRVFTLRGLLLPVNMAKAHAVDSLGNDLIIGAMTPFPTIAFGRKGSDRVMALSGKRWKNTTSPIVRFDFSLSVTIDAAAQASFFLGVYIAGSTQILVPPMASYGFDDGALRGLYPSSLVIPFHIPQQARTVSSVDLIVSGSTNVAPRGELTLTVTVNGPTRPEAVTVFLFLNPLHGLDRSAAGYSAVESPVDYPLALMTPIFTVSPGTPTVVRTNFTRDGAAGLYNVTAVCASVSSAPVKVKVLSPVSAANSWVKFSSIDASLRGEARDNQHAGGSPSSSSAADVEMEEFVATPWSVLPSVRVLDAAGDPVSGKRMTLRDVDDLVELVFVAPSSDRDGWIEPSSVIAAFAPDDEYVATFALFVDNVELLQFDVLLYQMYAEDTCMLDFGANVPLMQLYSGVPLPSLIGRAVDAYGAPILEPVFLIVSAASQVRDRLHAGSSPRTTILTRTAADGSFDVARLVVSSIPTPMYSTLYFQCMGASVADVFSVGSGSDSGSLIASLDDMLPDLTYDVHDEMSLFQEDQYGYTRFAPIIPLRFLVAPRILRIKPQVSKQQCTDLVPATGMITCSVDYDVSVDWASTRFQPMDMTVSVLAAPPSYQFFYSTYQGTDIATVVTTGPLPGDPVVTMTMALNPSVEGRFLLAAVADGVVFSNSLVMIDVSPPPLTITVVSPSEWLGGADVEFGILQQPPVIKVEVTLPVVGRVPLPNAIVYAQLCVDGTEMTLATGDFAQGAMACYDRNAPSQFPMSQVSGVTGRCSFQGTGLGLMGVTPNKPFMLRFRVGESVYVDENPVIGYRFTGQVDVYARGTPRFAAPGIELIAFQASGGDTDSRPLVAKIALSSPTGISVPLDGPLMAMGWTTGITLEGLRLPVDAVSGTYTAKVVVPGGASAPFSVIVSDVPTQMVAEESLPKAALIGQTLKPAVQVLTNGVPLANVIVSLSAAPVDGCRGSGGEECGTLTGRVTAITDDSGVAAFSVAFTAGASGSYKFTFTTGGTDMASAEAILGNAQSQAVQIIGAQLVNLGVPEALLGSMAAGAVPSLLAAILPDPTMVTSPSPKFTLVNLIGAVKVETEPALTALVTELPQQLSTQPVIRVVNATGGPIANVSVSLRPDDGLVLDVPGNLFSDGDGIVRFTGVRVVSATPGDHKITFVAKGILSPPSGSLSLTMPEPESMDTQMKIISFAVIAMLLPLMIANVPHTSWRWLPVTVISLTAVAALAIVEFSQFLSAAVLTNESKYLTVYVAFMICLFAFMILALLGLTVLHVRKMLAAKNNPAAVRIDAEDRAWHGFRYTTWLVNARRDPSYDVGVHRAKLNSDRANSTKGKIHRWCHAHKLTFVSLVEDIKFTDDVSLPPLVPPKDIHVSYIPLRFYIVLAIMLVLFVMVIIVSLYLVERLQDFIFEIYSVLPKPPPAAVGNWDEVTKQSLTELCDFIAKTVPQLAWIAEVLRPLTSYSFFSTAAMCVAALWQIYEAIPAALIVAHIFAACSMFAVAILTYVRLPELQMRARRGEYRQRLGEKAEIALADEYIGIHCVLFILQHQLVFWVLFLIMIVLFCPFALNFAWDYVGVSLLVTLAISMAQDLFTDTIISRFVVDQMEVKQPLLAGLFSVYAAAMGVFSGLIGAVTRTCKALGCIIFFSPFLEFSVIPGPLELSDDGFVKFYSMIIADAAYNHPVMLVALSIFIVDTRLVNSGAQAAKGGSTELFNRNSFGRDMAVASVVNTVMQRFDFLVERSGMPDRNANHPACHLVSLKYRRIAKRWWLLWVLHSNPSIRRFRKWRIWEENHIDRPLPSCGDGNPSHSAKQAAILDQDSLAALRETLLHHSSTAPSAHTHRPTDLDIELGLLSTRATTYKPSTTAPTRPDIFSDPDL
jgi:hypothetical protein